MKKSYGSQHWFVAETGMTLLTVLIMIGLLSLFIISLMQSIYLYSKLNSRFRMKHDQFYALESVAHKINNNFINYARSNCITKRIRSDYLATNINKNDCIEKFAQRAYYYQITDLGKFPCLQIHSKDKIDGSHHWLITVSSSQGVNLQWRIAKQATTDECLAQTMRKIEEGLISWRVFKRLPRLSRSAS